MKVVELQRRALPHFHAVVRLDAATAPGQAVAPPDVELSAGELAELVHRAAERARLEVDGPRHDRRTIRFGAQIDVKPLHCDGHPGTDPTAETGSRVAAYLAKYVTKSVADLGLGARRLSPNTIADLDVTDHIRRVLNTIVELAQAPDRHAMAGWLHTLGYRGHITTKTRQYSTTMGALRARRQTWQAEQQHGSHTGGEPAGERTFGEPVEWRVANFGHATRGDQILALTAAEKARQILQVAHDELAAGPPDQTGE